jgi:hypothetical protein
LEADFEGWPIKMSPRPIGTRFGDENSTLNLVPRMIKPALLGSNVALKSTPVTKIRKYKNDEKFRCD